MCELPPPEHMDRWSRNERLFRYLRDLGLFVVPIYSDGEHPGIEYMQVATSMPESPLFLAPETKSLIERPTKRRRRLVALAPIVQPVKRL